jgi:hypothetical protein
MPFVARPCQRRRKICAISQHDPAKAPEMGAIVLGFGGIVTEKMSP